MHITRFFARRPILATFACLATLGAAIFVAAGLLDPDRGRAASGARRSESVYVTMRDGVRLAVRVRLPRDLAAGERVPAVLETTRYGTEYEPRFLLRAGRNLGILDMTKPHEAAFLGARYALVYADARGSGASFGSREMECSREEIADIGEVIDWIASRRWSDGKVCCYGISYSGNTAELALASGRKAVAAVAPLYPDFDVFSQNARPGGIGNAKPLAGWSESLAEMDANRVRNAFVKGWGRVDGDRGGRLLAEAVAGHRGNIDISTAFAQASCADDLLAPGYRADSLSPFKYVLRPGSSSAPIHVRVGWLDAGTVNGAIERFLTYPNPQTLVIGPWSHAGWHFYDPFLGTTRPRPELDREQAAEVVAFFDAAARGAPPSGKLIRYYTMGEGTWKTSEAWPVPGFESRRLYFAEEGGLVPARPADAEGADSYQVDFSASTGESNRWFTNFGGGAIAYPDRAAEDRKLLCYTSEPLGRDLEITGQPLVELELASSEPDAAVFAYLEVVAPDGRVTYVTEGELRATHRAELAPEEGRAILGPRHSFLRGDAAPMPAGEAERIRIGMQATSVLVPSGSRLRIAIAGHDGANFERVPAQGLPTFTVSRNALKASFVELPCKER